MTTIYRTPPAAPPRAPRTPWWRIARAWLTGSLSRIPEAQYCRGHEAERRRLGLPTKASDGSRAAGYVRPPSPDDPAWPWRTSSGGPS